MSKGLTSISAILGDFHVIQKPELRGEPKTPPPMRQQVTSKTPRVPINKQAAMIVARAPYWAKLDPSLHPASVKLPVVEPKQDRALIEARQQIAKLSERVARLKETNRQLESERDQLVVRESQLKAEIQRLHEKVEFTKRETILRVCGNSH
jgi:septal ring factor EnvC (AmiA/AmiB activator)